MQFELPAQGEFMAAAYPSCIYSRNPSAIHKPMDMMSKAH